MKLQKSLSVRLYELLKSEFPHSSKNLQKFARKINYSKNNNRVFKSHVDGDIYIGVNDGGCLVGARLNAISVGNLDLWAFSYLSASDCDDVTEWFINEYSTKGMCAYTEFRHAWLEDFDDDCKEGTERTCQHCGKVEVLKSEMVKRVWWEVK